MQLYCNKKNSSENLWLHDCIIFLLPIICYWLLAFHYKSPVFPALYEHRNNISISMSWVLSGDKTLTFCLTYLPCSNLSSLFLILACMYILCTEVRGLIIFSNIFLFQGKTFPFSLWKFLVRNKFCVSISCFIVIWQNFHDSSKQTFDLTK